MFSKLGQTLVFLGALIIALLFVKLMYDMSANMTQMTAHVGSLSQDVSDMRASVQRMSDDMAKMRESVQRMDANIQNMGSAVEQGGKMFQQWNPAEIMR
jgi:methyl-accepting chemotaxis protein